ncbi:hypothetical protein GF361_03845 [Candidatus Woesearchaeota archaeon]|nr:hypothetical protein [Candidatus Woesearchaeota archaeon]
MKKAQMDYIKAMIITLTFLIIMLAFISLKLYPAIKESARLTTCKTSVETHAKAHAMKFDFSKNIECPTKELVIKESDKTEIKTKLAKELAECWEIFGKGKLDLFKNEAIYCAVCSRIDFKKDNIIINDFSEFLLTTDMPRKDITYADFLAGYSTPKAEKYAEDILSKSGNLPEIDTSKTYSTLFIYAKGKDSISNLKDSVGGTANAVIISGLTGGAAAGIGTAAVIFILGSNPVGWITAGAITVGTTVSAIYTYFAGEPPEWMALTLLTEYTEENLDKFNCEYLPVAQSE